MQLKFASYNIHKAIGLDRRRDPERIIAVLRELDADVIALQEADRRVGARASVIPKVLLDDTPWEAVPVAKRRRSIGWHGNALLIRRKMRCLGAGALDLPTLEPRGAAMAEIAHEGTRLRVIGMHLDLSGFRRRDQIRAVLSVIERERSNLPTVLMGDFNQWGIRSGAMGEFRHGWQMLAPGASYPARRPIARLDRIVASSDCRVLDGGVHHSTLAARASDHLPIWASLRLPKNKATA